MVSKSKKWFHYQRGTVYFGRLYIVLKANRDLYQKYFKVPFGAQVYYNNQKSFHWYLERNWLLRLGNILISDLSKNSKYAQKFRKNWRNLYKRAKELSDKIIFALNLNRLSRKQLEKIYLDWVKVAQNFHSLTNISVDAIDEALLLQIQTELKKIIKDRLVFEEKFKIFNTPASPTYIQKRELEVLELAMKIRKKQDKRLNWKDWKEEIAKIVDRWWWSTLGWMPVTAPYQARDVKKEIKKYLSLSENRLRDQYLYLKDFSQKTKEIKRKELKKLNAGKRLRRLLNVFEQVALYHDQRKEGQLRLITAQDKILREIIKRGKGLQYSDLVWLKVEEVLRFLRGDAKLKNIAEQRKKHTICYITRDDFVTREGKPALELKSKLLPDEKIQQIKEFKGMPASLGKVKARVKVSLDPNYLNENLRSGEILVTSQTTPNFVPAMKKASAIITDDGGATCHAAIISRELGIPCIVGTKIATQVLKDGDQVEMDAEKGIIKKL